MNAIATTYNIIPKDIINIVYKSILLSHINSSIDSSIYNSESFSPSDSLIYNRSFFNKYLLWDKYSSIKGYLFKFSHKSILSLLLKWLSLPWNFHALLSKNAQSGDNLWNL